MKFRWQEILKNSVHNGAIKAGHLRCIPHLKTCRYWDRAVFLGRVYYKLHYCTFDGGLIKYDNRIYYINSAQINALTPYLKWNLSKEITVMEED